MPYDIPPVQYKIKKGQATSNKKFILIEERSQQSQMSREKPIFAQLKTNLRLNRDEERHKSKMSMRGWD